MPRNMEKPKSIHIVYADWCPHCGSTTVEPLVRKAAELGIQCALHNIDTEDGAVADELVRKYGDWTPDYLVPQVFLEYEGSRFKHVLTGDPRSVALTRRAVEDLMASGVLSG
jgi:glutaredoxin